MRRLAHLPRAGWQARVESVGLPHHTAADGAPYWDESASYLLTAAEVDALEAATNELHRICLAAVAHVVTEGRWTELAIPAAAVPLVERSWRAAGGAPEPTLYGRFDLAYDAQSPPRLLEYNADTPTALVEAAVAQWYWLQDVDPAGDQFNSIHERLVAAWPDVAGPRGAVHFAAADDVEDSATITYLRDTAEQAGLAAQQLLMSEVGWDAGRRRFVDVDDAPISAAFKLYPWEWMTREAFGPHLLEAAGATRWIEPPWKMLLSNKGILPILWELFPDHPNLLPAYFDEWRLDAYARKPLLSREGANVSLVMFGDEIAHSAGDYGAEGYVYQAIAPLPRFDGRTPVVGAWIVAGEAAGIGIREADGPITTNTSRFVPHRIG
ncbi:putative glutathionylspermidine synthase [Gemmatimonadetes bacterium T265]|nr:putative glutathionylspermidine synthase [Gemmatimonadetes bacterium T265]